MATKTALKTKKIAQEVFGELETKDADGKDVKITAKFIEEVVDSALNAIAAEYSLSDAVKELETRKENNY